jgi:hypothetical protein
MPEEKTGGKSKRPTDKQAKMAAQQTLFAQQGQELNAFMKAALEANLTYQHNNPKATDEDAENAGCARSFTVKQLIEVAFSTDIKYGAVVKLLHDDEDLEKSGKMWSFIE